MEMTPQKDFSVPSKLELTNLRQTKTKIKLKKSNVITKPIQSNTPYSLQAARIKRKKKTAKKALDILRNPSGRVASLHVSSENNPVNYKTSTGGRTDKLSTSLNDRYATIGHSPQYSLPFRGTYQHSFIQKDEF